MGGACTKSSLLEVHRHRLHLLTFDDSRGSCDGDLPRRGIDTCRAEHTSDLDIRSGDTRESCWKLSLDIATIMPVDILELDLAFYWIDIATVVEDEGHGLCSLLREHGL